MIKAIEAKKMVEFKEQELIKARNKRTTEWIENELTEAITNRANLRESTVIVTIPCDLDKKIVTDTLVENGYGIVGMGYSELKIIW